ncbi:MAG: zf-HC2 domain-containing protein [Acidobacteria bacterium]|nr:zf-HC2 domain-containing protein [Acidobacteriota bacterium]
MMTNAKDIINCSQFEELLTEYIDKTLDAALNGAVAAHALSCPLCHSLLNDVKESLEVCREMSAPATSMTRLEARVLSMTMPETAMPCKDFEEYLTDYLDGFLPAAAFHRWERHAALCTSCEDLPGMVVRSIAACYTYKMDELAVPAGLHERIMNMTLGTLSPEEVRLSLAARAGEWVRGLRFPIGIPQLAPVAMMLVFAFLVFSQTVSADGSLKGVYQKSVELAEQTYQQSAEAWRASGQDQGPQQPANSITNTEDQHQ